MKWGCVWNKALFLEKRKKTGLNYTPYPQKKKIQIVTPPQKIGLSYTLYSLYKKPKKFNPYTPPQKKTQHTHKLTM